MANIDTYLENIMQARYGRDVRQSIHDGIEAINGDAENAVDIATQAKGEAKTAQDSAQAYANQALAHEQQAQIYRNQAEQFKDEAFSGTPEGYEDVVAKVNSLKEHTGTYLAEVGTKEGSVLAKRIYGMSVQDGTPTPDSPVDIVSAKADFRCRGKNLIPYPYGQSDGQVGYGVTFNVGSDGGITLNGTANNTGLGFRIIGGTPTDLSPMLKIKPNQEYIISGTPSGSGSSSNNYKIRYTYIFFNDNGETLLTGYVYESGATVIAPSTSTKFRIVVDVVKNVVYDGSITCYPMITLADAEQTYEPYKHKDVTTNLTLRAIEVSSTDDYTYERDGKYYIADTVDWSEDRGYEITRRVGHVILDETRSDWYKATITQFDIYATMVDGAYSGKESSNAKKNRVLSTHFIPTISSGNKLYTVNAHDGKIYLSYAEYNTTTLADFKTWIANNHVTVDFILDSYTTEPITSEQAQALLSLKTYDEASYISSTSDVEPSVDLEYATSEMGAKALTGHNLGFKNALKLNDINTALIELGGN